MLITAREFERINLELGFQDSTLARRDFWESKEEAWMSLSTKGLKTWDKRVIKLFVVSRTTPTHHSAPVGALPTCSSHVLQEFGLRETTKGDGFDRPGVTLKCAKVQELATVKDWSSGMLAFELLDILCSKLPVHVIWGAIDDFMRANIVLGSFHLEQC